MSLLLDAWRMCFLRILNSVNWRYRIWNNPSTPSLFRYGWVENPTDTLTSPRVGPDWDALVRNQLCRAQEGTEQDRKSSCHCQGTRGDPLPPASCARLGAEGPVPLPAPPLTRSIHSPCIPASLHPCVLASPGSWWNRTAFLLGRRRALRTGDKKAGFRGAIQATLGFLLRHWEARTLKKCTQPFGIWDCCLNYQGLCLFGCKAEGDIHMTGPRAPQIPQDGDILQGK
jgi:hypothetical protein